MVGAVEFGRVGPDIRHSHIFTECTLQYRARATAVRSPGGGGFLQVARGNEKTVNVFGERGNDHVGSAYLFLAQVM